MSAIRYFSIGAVTPPIDKIISLGEPQRKYFSLLSSSLGSTSLSVQSLNMSTLLFYLLPFPYNSFFCLSQPSATTTVKVHCGGRDDWDERWCPMEIEHNYNAPSKLVRLWPRMFLFRLAGYLLVFSLGFTATVLLGFSIGRKLA